MSVSHLYAENTSGGFEPIRVNASSQLAIELAAVGSVTVQTESNNAAIATQATLQSIADAASTDGGAVASASLAIAGTDGTNHQTALMATNGSLVVAGLEGSTARALNVDSSGNLQVDVLSSSGVAASNTTAWNAAAVSPAGTSTEHVVGAGQRVFSACVTTDANTDISYEVSHDGATWFADSTLYTVNNTSRVLNFGHIAAAEIRLVSSAAATITATIRGA